MKIEIPKHIRIGDYKIKIKLVDKVNEDEDWGSFVIKELTIYIDKDISGPLLKDTLWHEILHALWNLSGVANLDGPDEETIVTIMTPVMVNFFRENPKIMEIYG